MSTAVQLNRLPLDQWTTREQLCLASAVSCSGDQNWMLVSRTLKHVYGNDTPSRPADWFSQKNCALQYGYMLENVETPKRKKRTSESASRNASPATVETPTDLILRRLNDERIQELKAEIRREQEEFAQIYRELKALQAGMLNEEQMREMWGNIEKQQEQERVEEMKFENQMREREQQRLEMQRNWRSLAPATTTTNASSAAAGTTTVDMDVEDIMPTGTQNITTAAATQAQQQVQPATSPLLSSLLKTSPTYSNSTPPMLPTSTNTSNMQSTRSIAPTITTLLTSGYVPNTNQPALTLKAGVPPQKAAQLLSSPISGPPSRAFVPVKPNTPQNLLSPSQAAPTLSMLLEKNKGIAVVAAANEDNCNDGLTPSKVVEPSIQAQFDDMPKPTPSDTNNDETPFEHDEDISTPTKKDEPTVNIFNEIDSDDPDPNEEQQLLEVFKNIGNIDELDIDVSAVIDDEEVDFLKDMAADSPCEDGNINNFDKDGADVTKMLSVTDDFNRESIDKGNVNLAVNEDKPSLTAAQPSTSDDVNVSAASENKPRKVETISSDDSNDNIPLAAVATLEQKAVTDKVIFGENCNDVALGNDAIDDGGEIKHSPVNTKTCIPSFDVDDDDKEHDKLEKQLADLVGANDTDESKNLEDEGKVPEISESSDVILIPTDGDDSSGSKAKLRNEKTNVDLEAAKIKKDLEGDIGILELSKEDEIGHTQESTEVGRTNISQHEANSLSLPPTIAIADTDDDSSATDFSIAIRKDDKISTSTNSTIKYSAPQERKGLHELAGATPVRPPLLRKLRDRDRSESPLTECDAHTASYNNANISNIESNTSNQQRLRRRYSSTPNNNDISVPNSPSSSDRDRDDLETRQSKKCLLNILYALQYSKNANNLQRAFHDNNVKFNEICLRPSDMHTIRKQIETGSIRSVTELQRDIMLMCQNGLMLFKQNTNGFNAANAFMQECRDIREFVTNPPYSSSGTREQQQQNIATHHNVKDSNKDMSKSLNVSGIGTKSRSSSRKSQRIS
ncbi:bromodomain-containing protein 8 isoform X2 [Eurosta solidaginis]|uniref:bromodomain-containing protein 8 isoform X2 n=1 Tax=Eurosta solidaginis TaxID=178769 RepID=UPI003530FB35